MERLTQWLQNLPKFNLFFEVSESAYELAAKVMSYALVFLLALVLWRTLAAARFDRRERQEEGQDGDAPIYIGILEVASGSRNLRYGLTRDNVVGRSRRCDITLPQKSVSKRHAHLYEDNEGMVLYALDKKAPVLINDQRVRRKTYVEDGDKITLGRVSMRLRLF
jgi:hypothetical protein